jgi:hypothetical protein
VAKEESWLEGWVVDGGPKSAGLWLHHVKQGRSAKVARTERLKDEGEVPSKAIISAWRLVAPIPFVLLSSLKRCSKALVADNTVDCKRVALDI